ncbi:MAG TPA: matrixin family metalloprotease [Phycisphaerae bacterium]|nr:matrixin family metalloprotease [Phycisphaerae bacterium]
MNASRFTSIGCMILAGAILIGTGCQQPPAVCTTDCDDNEVEPNNTFAVATNAHVDNTTRRLIGSINQRGDIDVYDLGPMNVGDTVSVRIGGLSGTLQPAFALYNGTNELINEDTLTSLTSRTASPQIDHIVRADSDPFYLAMSHNVAGFTSGQYELDITVERGAANPEPAQQVIYLNFSGGEINDPVFGRFEVGPFDAGDIDPIYEGQTEFMIQAIRETVEQNYARFDAVILDSINDGPLPSGNASEILFGGFNDLAFGAAQDVDLYNENPTDKAIIFVESFETFLFNQPPSPAGMSVAIGNVAAHEAGHLLGLHHVRDADAIMDEASPTFTLLADQEFITAPLSTSIFPLGNQDSAALLEVIIGLNPNPVAKRLSFNVEPPTLGPAATRSKCLNCVMRNALISGTSGSNAN